MVCADPQRQRIPKILPCSKSACCERSPITLIGSSRALRPALFGLNRSDTLAPDAEFILGVSSPLEM